MGTWRTGISSNDVYEDIHYGFFDLYNRGMDVSDITERLIKENQELIDSHEDQNNFWFTIAKSQWECKALDPEIFNRVKIIVETGKDIELWKELDASKSDLTKRQKVLDNFLQKISVEKKTPKKRKVRKLIDAVFEKGDCLIFELNDSCYGGAFVLEAEKNTEFGLNLICYLDINQKSKPTLNHFEKAQVIVTKKIGFDFSLIDEKLKSFEEKVTDSPEVCWHYASEYKKSEVFLEFVGNLEVSIAYDSSTDFQCFSHWNNLIPNINSYYEDIDQRRGTKKLKLKQLRKKYWLQQWL